MRSREAPFTAALNPFYVTRTADTYTTLFSTEVPNWVLVGAFALLLAKLFILTAGSILAPFGSSKDVPSLRVHVLVYMFVLAMYIGYVNSSTLAGGGLMGLGRGVSALGFVHFILLSPLFIFMPILCCYGMDAERRYWPNGMIRARSTLDGTPAGALPFLWALIGSVALALYLGVRFGGATITDSAFPKYAFFTLAFWTFFWAVGRLSSAAMLGLRTARTLQFAAYIVIVVLPVPFFSSIQSSQIGRDNAERFWEFYILRPLWMDSDRSGQALLYGLVLLLGSAVIAGYAEARAAARLSRLRTNDGRAFTTA
jgi:hypothetical protein